MFFFFLIHADGTDCKTIVFIQGHFIEVQVTDGALYRTKIHCYFLDQTRVIRPLPDEKNYHIFYQMLAGLSHEERGKV